MPLETGSFIPDLVPSNPLGTDLKAQGDDHLRLIKTCTQGSFPLQTEACDILLTQAVLDLLYEPLGFQDDTKVDVAGDTMTGLLTLSGVPTADLHASTKKYVDDAIAAINLGLPAPDFTSNNLAINTPGATVQAHGLGQIPKLWSAYVLCTGAEGGWAIGDRADITSTGIENRPNATVIVDATNVTVVCPHDGDMLRKDTALEFRPVGDPLTNFVCVVDAWV